MAPYWCGLLVCAIDGTIMTAADSTVNLSVFTKQRGGATGGSSYPMLRLGGLGRLWHPQHHRRRLRAGQPR
jgi:hypothetical protein